jgi:4-hydroxybenzoate polyprenyltransferase
VIHQLPRLLSSIRAGEVLVLQGTPLIGIVFALDAFDPATIGRALILIAGSICLVAHVFLFNDWSGIDGDVHDARRKESTFLRKGVSQKEVLLLSIAFLLAALVLLKLLGIATFVVGSSIACLSFLYSAPIFHLKGHPVINSGLHLLGGSLHFLLGYASLAAVGNLSLVISLYFGLVFAAGHCMHELRDCDIDTLNGIRTNAVAFGRTPMFWSGLGLFFAADALLLTLAISKDIPRLMMLALPLNAWHYGASWHVWRQGLSADSLGRLQRLYRILYAAIGILMLLTVLAK